MKNRTEYNRVLLKAQKFLIEGILIFDTKQKKIPLVFVNKSVGKILGYSNKELIGKSYSQIFNSKISNKESLEKLHFCFENYKSSIIDLNLTRKDSNQIFCRISLSPIPDPASGTEYIICVLRDVTDARDKLLNKVKLSVVESTLRSVNDIVFNYFNNIQLFRWEFEKHCDMNKIKLQEFDKLNELTIHKLKKMNEIKEYKEKKITDKISILNYS